jgi:hypothetical protein
LVGYNTNDIFVAEFARDAKPLNKRSNSMDRDQSQSHVLTEPSEPGSRAKIKEQTLPLKQSRFSSELKRLRAVSKRTLSSGSRMAVQKFLGAIFNQVYRWESEDRLEEELYRLLDSVKPPVPLKIGEAFAVVIYCTAPHVDQKSRSKWARALRYAAANKPDDETIKKFIKRNGGINACASNYAQYVRRSGKG